MFRKSSYSQGASNCVEVDNWRKSSHSDYVGAITCVEAGQREGNVAVRDTQDRGGFVLKVSNDTWTRFVGALKAA